MKIFLDAHDLINLLEGRGSCTVGDFHKCLQEGGHTLVLSPIIILEVSAPLSNQSTDTVVTKLLNNLESLQPIYINDSQIQPREIVSAIHSYTAGSEYVSIVPPYVTHFDQAIPISGQAPTSPCINHGLAETVFTMWRGDPTLFRWPDQHIKELQFRMNIDRSMPNHPTVAKHFPEKLRRDMKLYQISHPQGGLDNFAKWIYETPTRCPAVRLSYEVFHQLRRNIGDQPSANDFGDFAHVQCVPYVDLITLDRRMSDYVRRATQGWDSDLTGKVKHNLDAVLREL